MSDAPDKEMSMAEAAPADGNVATRGPAALDAARGQPGAVGHAEPQGRRCTACSRCSRSHHGAVRGLVTLLHDDGELHVEASDGLDDASRAGPLSASAKGSPARSSRAASRSSCRASAASRRSSTAPPRRPELPQAGAELHLRADPAEPPGGRRAGRRPQASSRSATTTAA